MDGNIADLRAETCFFVEFIDASAELSAVEEETLVWILQDSRNDIVLTKESRIFDGVENYDNLIEIGPRFNFSTAASTNSVAICHSAALFTVIRIESSTRYMVDFGSNPKKDLTERQKVSSVYIIN